MYVGKITLADPIRIMMTAFDWIPWQAIRWFIYSVCCADIAQYHHFSKV